MSLTGSKYCARRASKRICSGTSAETSPITDPPMTTDSSMNADSSSKPATNREKFIALAEKRTSKALQAIAIIGNLSNKSNYSYNEDDVRKIKKALINQVNQTISKFDNSDSKRSSFSL
jgi:SLT domain-containing protein